ncbi:MAG: GtrA family protein [Actinomycetaceae bacterium]|nr:GtrA family protein [Actinomycetaceae bacterium]
MKFGTVGLAAYIVDFGLFNLFAYSYPHVLSFTGDASMAAKILSTAISIVFSWLLNRLWTFKHAKNDNQSKEFFHFLLVNIAGMLIALACLYFSRYILGFKSQLADNISANGVGLILGTAFRYIMYRYVIFTHREN